jgi:preprotein translocase subunit SecD
VLPFHLDAAGASLLHDLTRNNLGRDICILLDDVALTAPTIKQPISDRGVISFGSAPQNHDEQARELYQLLKSPPVPALLTPVDVKAS